MLERKDKIHIKRYTNLFIIYIYIYRIRIQIGHMFIVEGGDANTCKVPSGFAITLMGE